MNLLLTKEESTFSFNMLHDPITECVFLFIGKLQATIFFSGSLCFCGKLSPVEKMITSFKFIASITVEAS